ncbi:rho guanine nucleotide exchange factor 11-like isoform X3 [Branchiostoma lanceolatum]|uniref:rho guanine nucleotide exchange factor 11-like isoform X3 n=1 Tax=Branchiostoma lanceolatum TaxID=7740 RepID=UPI003453E4C5
MATSELFFAGLQLGGLSKEPVSEKKSGGSPDHKAAQNKRDSTIETVDPSDITICLNEVDPTGVPLIQRCVIIQRDEKGYGLTVSGDNPVFVQSVKEEGAAQRAGVQQGDRIIKVNGTLVTQSNHIEVVKLIKSGPYVALTLLGRPPGSNQTPLPPPHEQKKITAPVAATPESEEAAKLERVNTFRKMLEQEQEYYEKIKDDYSRNPSTKLQRDFAGASTRVRTLEQKLYELTGISRHHGVPEAPMFPPVADPAEEDGQDRLPDVPQSNNAYSPPLRITTYLNKGSTGSESSDFQDEPKHRGNTHMRCHSNPEGAFQQLLTTPASQQRYSDPDSAPPSKKTRSSSSVSVPLLSSHAVAAWWRHRGHSLPLSRDAAKMDSTVVPGENVKEGGDVPPHVSPVQSRRLTDSSVDVDSGEEWKQQSSPDVSQAIPCRRLTFINNKNRYSVLSEGGYYTPSGSPVEEVEERSDSDTEQYYSPRGSLNGEDVEVDGGRLMPISPDVAQTAEETLFPKPPEQGTNPGMPSTQLNIISMEDDEFQSDNENEVFVSTSKEAGHYSPYPPSQMEDHGPFNSLELMKTKPAHQAVFLHYLMSNSDPSSLFFIVVTDSYKTGTMKEMRKWAYEIHSTFLVASAPLRIHVDDGIVRAIDEALKYKSNDEASLRGLFQAAQNMASLVVKEQLQDFRNKRALGLGSLFGDQHLHDIHLDHAKEMKVVEQTLLPHLDQFMEDGDIVANYMGSPTSRFGSQRSNLETRTPATARNSAMASCIVTFMKQVGVKIQTSGSQVSPLDRCPSFTAKDKRFPRFRDKNKKSVVSVKGHHFVPMHYTALAFCNHCGGVLWGIGNQGYQCQDCEYNIHKGSCIDACEDHCVGGNLKGAQSTRKKEKNKEKRETRYFPKVFRPSEKERKSAILPPSQIPTYPVQPLMKDDDEEISKLKEDRIVTTMVGGYENLQQDPSSPATSPHPNSRGNSPRSQSPDITQEQPPPDQPRRRGSLPLLFTSELVAKLSKSNRKTSTIERSESLKGRINGRDSITNGSGKRSKSDVDVDAVKVATETTTSGSTSTSSLSSSNSSEAVHRPPSPTDVSRDSDFDVDLEQGANWQETVDRSTLKSLSKKEIKRQEVINELFHTEKAHVRNLKVLDLIFHRRMLQDNILPGDVVKQVFPNMQEIIDMHSTLNQAMKAKKKADGHIVGQIGDLLLDRFDNESGEHFRHSAAVFCANQKAAVEMIRVRQKKDSKLQQFMAEAESNPLCRRLSLKDHLPQVMQRLTKYPLLLEKIANYTIGNPTEQKKINQAIECCKRSLEYVNQTVRDCENHQKLEEFSKKLDKSSLEKSSHPLLAEFKELDLPSKTLLHDGALTWRLGRTRLIDLHMLLMEDCLVLMQKEDDNRYVLKCQSTMLVSGKEDTKTTHSPIIKLNNLLTRNVATDNKAFFLVSTSQIGPQIYELVASTATERKTWFKHITEAAEAYKAKEKERARRVGISLPPPPRMSTTHEDPIAETTAEEIPTNERNGNLETVRVDEDSVTETQQAEETQVDGREVVQPSEVLVSQQVVYEETEVVLTPLEKLRRKDEAIRKSLEEKHRLLAELAGVPEDQLTSEIDGKLSRQDSTSQEPEPRDLVMAAILQANTLTTLVNQCLKDPERRQSSSPAVEGEVKTTSQEGSPAVSRPTSGASDLTISLPCDKLTAVTSRLSDQLTQLLGMLTSRDDERGRVYTELQDAQEELARYREQIYASPSPSEASTAPRESRPSSMVSVASSTTDPGEEFLLTVADEEIAAPAVPPPPAFAEPIAEEQEPVETPPPSEDNNTLLALTEEDFPPPPFPDPEPPYSPGFTEDDNQPSAIF